jgi:hypothetical protein
VEPCVVWALRVSLPFQQQLLWHMGLVTSSSSSSSNSAPGPVGHSAPGAVNTITKLQLAARCDGRSNISALSLGFVGSSFAVRNQHGTIYCKPISCL